MKRSDVSKQALHLCRQRTYKCSDKLMQRQWATIKLSNTGHAIYKAAMYAFTDKKIAI